VRSAKIDVGLAGDALERFDVKRLADVTALANPDS
jgi:hypothetical protein